MLARVALLSGVVRELPLIPSCKWELHSAQVPGNARRIRVASRTAASDCRTAQAKLGNFPPQGVAFIIVPEGVRSFRTKPLGESNEAFKLQLVLLARRHRRGLGPLQLNLVECLEAV